MSRVYANCKQMISEEIRNIQERGIEVSLKTYQNKNIENDPNFLTKEIIGETFTIINTSDAEEMYERFKTKFGVELPKEWADAEFKERISDEDINPGEAWKLRKDVWQQFLNEDSKFTYTYNNRIRYNKNTIIKELQRDSNTRRAFLSIFDSTEDSYNMYFGNRISCSIGYQFLIREIANKKKLNIIYMIRSCDAFTHFINDVYLSVKFQRYIAEKLGIEVGHFTMFISSFHAYYKDLNKYQIF